MISTCTLYEEMGMATSAQDRWGCLYMYIHISIYICVYIYIYVSTNNNGNYAIGVAVLNKIRENY